MQGTPTPGIPIFDTVIHTVLAQHVTPYEDRDRSKKDQVEEMFDNIAHRYDFLNHLLSLGIDNLWRRRAVRHIAQNAPDVVMDMATGTGDFAFEIARRTDASRVVGFDLSEGMLAVGRQKAVRKSLQDVVVFEKGDSEDMVYDDDSFDAMTVGFGVRNFEHLTTGLAEMHRVLRPGGDLVILEVSRPTRFPMKQIFNLYFLHILPLIGRLFSRDHRAYSYLPESVGAFPHGDDFVAILHEVGFRDVEYKPLTFGICAMYTCRK